MTRGRCATVLLLTLFVVPFIPAPAHASLGGCITIKTASGAMSTDCSGGATPDKPSTQIGADKNSQNADISCPNPDTYHKYDSTKGKTWIEIRNDLKVTITNLYGKPCSDIRNDVEVVEGKCVAAQKCQATECFGKDCKLPDTKVNPQTGSGSSDPAKQGTTAGLDDLNQTKEINASPMGKLGDTPQSVLGKVFSGSDFQSPSLYDAYGVQPLFDSSLENPGIVPSSVYENLPQAGITADFGSASQLGAELPSLGEGGEAVVPPQTFAPSAQQTGFESPENFPQLPSSPQTSIPQSSFPAAGSPIDQSNSGYYPQQSAPISDPWTVEPAPTQTSSGLAPIDAAYEPQTKFTTDQTFYPVTSDWTKLGSAQYPFLSADKIASGQIGGQFDQGGVAGVSEPGQIRTAQDIGITSPADAYASGKSIESTVPAVGLNGGWATDGIAGSSLWHGNVSAINGNGTNIGYEWDPTGTYVNFGTPPSGVLAEQQAERDANLVALQPEQTAVPDRSVLSIDPGQAPVAAQTFTPEKTTWDTVKEYAGNAWDGAKYAASEFFGIGSANAKPSQETIAQGGAGETIEGQASVYNPYLPGEKSGGPGLATGGRYDPQSYDAAIQTDIGRAASCGTGVTGSCYALVEQGDKALVVKVNDNGPLVGNRIIDLNQKSMDYFTGEKNSVRLLDDVSVTMLPKDGTYTAGPVDSATAQELRTGSSEPALTRTGGSEVNAPVVGGDTRQDLAFGENPPVTAAPNQSKFAYEWQPDVSYGALGNTPKSVTLSDLPDITPIENRFPTASWIPNAQLSGEELTAQIRASAEYDATKGITEYPTNDALSQDNQIYADEQAALQDRLAQADRESNAYVDQELSRIPLGPSVSGEEITAQINKDIDNQINATVPLQETDAKVPTQAEAQAQLLAESGKPLDISSIYEPANRGLEGDASVNAAIDKALAEGGVTDQRKTFDQATDQKIRGLFDQKIKDAQAQVSFAQDLLARSETPIAKDAAQVILDESNARLNKIVDNAISYSAGYPNDALKAAGERLAQNEGRGVLNNIFQANADQGKALAGSLAEGINLSDMSATDVAKGVGWAGAELWATTNGAIANLGNKIGLPGFAGDPALEVADAIDPHGSAYKTVADAAAIAPFAVGPVKNLVGAGLDSATGAVFGTVTRDAAAAGFGVENAGIGATVRDSAGFALERPTLQFSKLSDGSFGLAEEAVAAEASAASRSGVLALQESGGASVSTGQRGASALDGAAANTGVGKDLTSGLQRNTVTELPEAGVAQEGRALSTGTGGRVVEPDYIPGDGTNPPRIIISAKPNTPVAAEVVAEGEGVAAGESLGGAVTEGAPRAITRAANDNIPVPEVAIAPEQVRVQTPAPTFYERAVDTWTNFKNDVSEFFSPTPAPRIEPTVNANPSTVRISEPIEYPSYVPSQTSGTVPGRLAEPQVAPVVSGPSGEISAGSQINHAITPEPTIPSSVAKPSVVADEQEIRSLLSRLAQQNETPLQRMAGDLGDVRPGAQGSPAGSAAGDLSTVQVNQPISPTNQAPSLDGAVGSAKNSLNTFTPQESAAAKQLESLAGKTSEDGIERTQGLGSLREAVYRDPVEPVITTDKPVHIELPPTAEVNAKISLGELPADGVRVELTDANSRVAISATAEQRAALARNADSSGRTIEVVVSREDLARLESGAGDVTLYPAPKTPYASAADTGKSAALETVATPGWFSGVRDRVSKVWDNIFSGKPAEIGDLSAETGGTVPRVASPSVKTAEAEAKQLDLPLGEARKTDLVSQVARSSAEEKPTVDPTYLNWRSSSQKAALGGTATLSAPLFFAYMNPNSVLNSGDTKAGQGESGAQSVDETGFTGTKQGQTTSATYYGPEFTDAFGTIPGQEVLKDDYYCIRSVFPLAVTQLKAGSVFPTGNCVNLPPSKASGAPVAAPTAAPTQSAPQIANQQSGFGGILNAIGSAVGGFLGNLLKGQGNAQNQNSSPTNPATPTTPTTPSTPGTPASDGKPQVSLVANPSAISAGQQSTLSWSSVGASQCAVVDGAGVAVGSSSPLTVSPQTTTTYKITCGDAVSSQVTVTVK